MSDLTAILSAVVLASRLIKGLQEEAERVLIAAPDIDGFISVVFHLGGLREPVSAGYLAMGFWLKLPQAYQLELRCCPVELEKTAASVRL